MELVVEAGDAARCTMALLIGYGSGDQPYWPSRPSRTWSLLARLADVALDKAVKNYIKAAGGVLR
ncbi:MAG: hypothetical protein R2701_11185 [Acidimicrobiales bacterium]